MTKTKSAGAIAPALLNWWDVHGRKNLPWQRDRSFYRIWISEIMLQQTQVTTVERYYDRFMATFPTVDLLAAAELDHVLHLWSGLGYYARARNLHRAARIICKRFGGELPSDFDELESLPGIGRSTAGAILALAANQKQPILDGNAKRVLARVLKIEGWPGSTAVGRVLWEAATICTSAERPGDYTQAIMDLGASVCTRRNAACNRCPLTEQCVAHRTNRVDQIPAPRPKRPRPQREVVLVMVVHDDGAVLLQRRPNLGVWGGLWCFPETAEVNSVSEWCQNQVGITPDRIEVRPLMRHSFTHFDLDMTPVAAHIRRLPEQLMDDDQWLWFKLQQPAAVGLATPVARLLESFGESR